MKHTLQVQLRARDGAVLRTLGLIERRGFRLDALSVGEPAAGGRSMSVSVSSERPVELLKRQLERLHDVLRVECQKDMAQWASGSLSH
jgi:acetolactate synthase regulatory subunit